MEVLPRSALPLKARWRGMRLLSHTASGVASAMDTPSQSPLRRSNRAASGTAQRGISPAARWQPGSPGNSARRRRQAWLG